ncbi:hypothetical protein LJC20_07385, partial [Eubacteriales bacterium OttesenSCG-928-M02]|nr:hypothetical protein [Eubacteriales bacterium OttesenSCG-928-M02]
FLKTDQKGNVYTISYRITSSEALKNERFLIGESKLLDEKDAFEIAGKETKNAILTKSKEYGNSIKLNMEDVTQASLTSDNVISRLTFIDSVPAWEITIMIEKEWHMQTFEKEAIVEQDIMVFVSRINAVTGELIELAYSE